MATKLTKAQRKNLTAARVRSTLNYAEAKRILRDAAKQGLVMLRYYNGYKQSQSLKVFWWAEGETPTQRRTSSKLVGSYHSKLMHLADYTNIGERGGDIYGFTVRAGK